MTFYEAVLHYTQEKQKGNITKQQIKENLLQKHHFSATDTKLILSEIAEGELADVQHKKNVVTVISDSKFFSYFFLGFSIVVIVTSVYYIFQDNNDPLQKYMPYMMILGGVFLIIRHGSRVFFKK